MRSKVAKRILDKMPEDVKIFVRLYADIVIRVNQLIKENGYTQKQLADKLDKTPSEIHKWLNSEHNFTLKSIAKLQAELGETILYVPERKTATVFIHGQSKTFQTTVYKTLTVISGIEFQEDWKTKSTPTEIPLANAG